MNEYTARVGIGNGEEKDLYCIPCRETADDGKEVAIPECPQCEAGEHPHLCPNVQPLCDDCHSGHLVWAEAGYVPWHRICNYCGSHWDLYPGKHYRRARFYS